MGTQLPLPKAAQHTLPFSAHVYFCQTAGVDGPRMLLGREIGLGRVFIVLDGELASPKKGHSSPRFSAHDVYCGQADQLRSPKRASNSDTQLWIS